MMRTVLVFVFFVSCAVTATADKVKTSSPPKTAQAESLPSVRIVSACENEEDDYEEYFWCTIGLAIKEKDLSHCKRDMWGATSSCLYEVKKEFAFTTEDCAKAFEHKTFQEYCAKIANSQ